MREVAAVATFQFRKHMGRKANWMHGTQCCNPQSEHILDGDRLKEAMKLLTANVNALKDN